MWDTRVHAQGLGLAVQRDGALAPPKGGRSPVTRRSRGTAHLGDGRRTLPFQEASAKTGPRGQGGTAGISCCRRGPGGQGLCVGRAEPCGSGGGCWLWNVPKAAEGHPRNRRVPQCASYGAATLFLKNNTNHRKGRRCVRKGSYLALLTPGTKGGPRAQLAGKQVLPGSEPGPPAGGQEGPVHWLLAAAPAGQTAAPLRE